MANLILSPKKALDAFIMEFGSVVRAFNPSARAYQGYEFVKRLIMFDGKALRAWVAWDYAKENIAIVAEDGSFVDFTDYNKVEIYDATPLGARDLFRMFFPTLWGIFNSASIQHNAGDFEEKGNLYYATDFGNKNQFVVPIGGEPFICDPE